METKPVFSKEERAYHVNQWRKSGKSQKAYSKEAGISANRLHYWTYGDPSTKLKRKKEAAIPAFVPLQFEEEFSPSLDITLELPDGVRIHLQGPVSASYIKNLLA